MNKDARISDAIDSPGRRRPLRWYLVVTALVSLLPLVIFTGAILLHNARIQRNAHERGMRETAAALSLAVDRECGVAEAVLYTLSESDLLDAGDFAGFHKQCAAVMEHRPDAFIILFDPSGQQLVNTLRPFGAPLPNPFSQSQPAPSDQPDQLPRGNPDTVSRAFATHQTVYSNLFISLSANRPIVTIDVPVMRGDRASYVLTMGILSDRFADLLREHSASEGRLTVILDGNGRHIARSSDSPKFVGRKVRPELIALIAQHDRGYEPTVNIEDVPVYRAWSRSPVTGWTTAASLPRIAIDGPIRQSLAWWAAGALLVLCLGMTVATLAARRIAAPITALAQSAEQVHRGQAVRLPAAPVREVQELHEALTFAADAVRRHAAEHQQRLTAEARREQAEIENRRKDQFLAVLSHELRNPLAAIVHGARLLPMVGSLNDQANRVTQQIDRQALQMSRLVDDLLDFARISHGKLRLHMERFDLIALLRTTVEDYRAASDDLKCDLELELPNPETRKPRDSRPWDQKIPTALWLNADRSRIVQIITNLLHNACKFTDDGGQVTITAQVDADRRAAMICVRDTGIGMSAQTLSSLFTPFTQDADSIGRSRGGLGLGLALARNIAELHGGDIAAHSEGLGKGSTFTLTLPLAAQGAAESIEALPTPESATAAPPATTHPAPIAASSSAFRVLVVEDSAPVADIFAIMLEELGHQVCVANNGLAALEQLTAFGPEVVFSDLSMPGISGLEMARLIRADETYRHVYLVAVTGFAQPEEREHALAAGFDEHLVKPVEIEQLTSLFETLASRCANAK